MLQVETRDWLPPRAWLAEIHETQAAVVCGAGVEIFAAGVFEGVWNGSFAARAFDRAAEVFGSGLLCRDGKLVAVGASHSLEALYLLRRKDRLAVSNSLTFLLEQAALDLPPGPDYGRRIASVVLGTESYARTLFKSGHLTLQRFVCEDLEIAGMEARPRPKAADPRFETFHDYRSHLAAVLKGCFANAAAPARRHPMSPLTTLSSGYDSAACAALARGLGCREAVTLRRARGGDPDSGRSVAEALGLSVQEFDRHGPREPEPGVGLAEQEVEFLASGAGGEDYPFRAFADRLPGRLLLTGFHGDKVWCPAEPPSRTLARGDLSGCSLAEFRLRVGFTHLPVPFIGARRHCDLRRISGAVQLRPFRVRGDYNRPIPRRIAEEQGVPRAAFGQTKRAASLQFFTSLDLLSTAARRDFDAFAASRIDRRTRLRQVAWRTRHLVLTASLALFQRARLRGWRVLSRRLVGDLRLVEHASPILSDLLFLWAIDRLRPRYRAPGETAKQRARKTAQKA